jgi:AP-2 complex subunit alpha
VRLRATNFALRSSPHLINHTQLIDPTAEVHSATLSDNPNIRFLALESLASLAQTTYARTEVKKNLPEILASLKSDARDDPTVHRKAVDVLYNACDKDTVQTVVKELLVFLKKSDYSIREDVVLKIAILSEKYATDFTW